MTIEIDDKALAAAVEEHFAESFKRTPTEAMRSAIRAYISALNPDFLSELDTAKKEVERCHARLEIDHYFRLAPDPTGEKPAIAVRVELPMEERATFPDAVAARDATIELIESALTEAKARIAELEGALEPFIATGMEEAIFNPITHAMVRDACKALRAALSPDTTEGGDDHG